MSRVPWPKQVIPKAFHKDWGRLNRTGRFNMARVKHAIMLIISNNGQPLLDAPSRDTDSLPASIYSGCRGNCHGRSWLALVLALPAAG